MVKGMLCLSRLDLVLVLNLVLVFRRDEVWAQTLVDVYSGENALLPCSYPEGRPASDVSVYWKDKQDNQVLTIRHFKNDPHNQSPQYQSRVQSFQHLYKDGNFSIILMKVNGSDNGIFECHMTPGIFQQNVRLNVTSKPRWSDRSGPSSGASVVTPPLLYLPVLLCLCL